MIQIRLVRVGDRLIGMTCSDRWNLESAGIGPIRWDRNQKHVKAARRRLAALGLTLSVVRNATVQVHPTSIEADSLGLAIVERLTMGIAA